ncbi:hypothetical protein TRFO_40837 [Tritrichomonas foetus]|uniref:Uncharacterized protein n=1 Tax=Tritrichomonas foetus TaxID=1144522 RepID=A0A1J4IZR0_9EUKA|nr:hypothetical protein TRFO_40837 [Tritrichomonas foetus]|eukprot:OHS92840.1 hypothetical protein TRFO_40837 [Tritrichomonas foetus]
MLALFLVAAFSLEIPSVIPDQYKDLVAKSKKNLRAHPNTPSMPKTGFYDLEGLSFTLKATLLNDQSRELRGVAQEGNVISFVPDRSLLNAQIVESSESMVYINIEEQNLYKLLDPIADDGTALLYNVEQIDPFSVFFDVNMKTMPSKSNDAADFKCEATKDHSFGARCKAEFGHNWQTPSGFQDGMDLKALELSTEMPGFTVFHGAYVRGYSSFGVNIHSITDIDIDADLDIGAAAGLGFRFKDHLGPYTLLDEGIRYPLYGYTTSFWGYNFGFSVDLFATVSLKNVNLDFPQELHYYRQAKADLKVAGHYKAGVSFDTPNFTFSSTVDTNLQNFSIKDYVENIRLSANPEFNLGLDIQVATGSSTLLLEGGGRFGMNWDFAGNPSKCEIPWLYGDTDAYIEGFYSNTEYKVWKWTIIPSFEQTWRLWDYPKTEDHCIFSDEKVEGSQGTVSVKGSDFMNIKTAKGKGSVISAGTISAIILAVVSACLVAALIVVSIQKKRLQETLDTTGILDSEAKFT